MYARLLAGLRSGGSEALGPAELERALKNVETASSSNCVHFARKPLSVSPSTTHAPSANSSPSRSSGAMIVPGLVVFVERAELVDGRVRDLLAVEDEDAAVLEVVDDPRDLELVVVDPEDGGDAVVRAGRRRVRVPLVRRPPGCVIECAPSSALADLSVHPAALTGFVRCLLVGSAAAAESRGGGAPAKPSATPAMAAPIRTARSARDRRSTSCCALLRRLDPGLVGHVRGRGYQRPPFSPGCTGKGCRPPTGLPCIGSMVIVALLIGLAVGAFAVLLAVRPALVERRRRIQEVIALERALAASEAELAVERGSRDERLDARSRRSRPRRSTRTARASSSSRRRTSPATCGRSRTRSSGWTSAPGVERVRQESYGALKTQVDDPGRARREPHERAANAARPRALGRGAAAQRRRVRGHGRALRLRRRRRRPTTTASCAPTSSSGSRAESTSSSTRRRRSSRTSTRSRPRRGRARAPPSSRITRARFASTYRSSRPRPTGASSTRRRTSS